MEWPDLIDFPSHRACRRRTHRLEHSNFHPHYPDLSSANTLTLFLLSNRTTHLPAILYKVAIYCSPPLPYPSSSILLLHSSPSMNIRHTDSPVSYQTIQDPIHLEIQKVKIQTEKKARGIIQKVQHQLRARPPNPLKFFSNSSSSKCICKAPKGPNSKNAKNLSREARYHPHKGHKDQPKPPLQFVVPIPFPVQVSNPVIKSYGKPNLNRGYLKLSQKPSQKNPIKTPLLHSENPLPKFQTMRKKDLNAEDFPPKAVDPRPPNPRKMSDPEIAIFDVPDPYCISISISIFISYSHSHSHPDSYFTSMSTPLRRRTWFTVPN
jgi:hypothetical protein